MAPTKARGARLASPHQLGREKLEHTESSISSTLQFQLAMLYPGGLSPRIRGGNESKNFPAVVM